MTASVFDWGSSLEGADRRRPRPLCSSQCQGLKQTTKFFFLYDCELCQAKRVITVLQGAAVSTATCLQLHKRAEKIAAALTEKGSINTGENVVLLYPPSESCYCLPVVCIWILDFFFHFACVYHLLGRHWFDRRLLRLSLRWMRSCKRQTSTPSEPCGHPAHCPHDNRCTPPYSCARTRAVFCADRFIFLRSVKPRAS